MQILNLAKASLQGIASTRSNYSVTPMEEQGHFAHFGA